jgi:hypothetical protein
MKCAIHEDESMCVYFGYMCHNRPAPKPLRRRLFWKIATLSSRLILGPIWRRLITS